MSDHLTDELSSNSLSGTPPVQLSVIGQLSLLVSSNKQPLSNGGLCSPSLSYGLQPGTGMSGTCTSPSYRR